MFYLIIFGASFLVATLMTPVAQQLSFRLGIVAIPGGRRVHSGKVPKLGGMPLMVALLVAWGLIYWLRPPQSESDVLLLPGVMLGTIVLFIGGLLDDYWDLPPWAQFATQFIGLGIAMRFDVFIGRFTNPLKGKEVQLDQYPEWWWLILLLTLIWIVGMINTINWLDGLDGLAAGVGTIAAVLFAWHSYTLEQYTVAAFPLALAGALLGFLIFNFVPAKIYLAGGAYLLGYQLATLSIISPAKIATALLVLAVPIIDVAWRIIDRLRHGRSPFQGDRGHLHFMLYDMGVPMRLIVGGYFLITLAFGLTAIWIPSPRGKLVVLVVLGTAVLTLLILLSNRKVD
ncbi:MAG: undecaprenyl/decaprenyl-phosphate alpha-N-acetylglucosaminyl 1-phosphate transferase [Chloroflexi bacterium]|nr:MAG: undecaprenyl/decaprenyl-phosphate alpha-N-acetylglucosaminyl 1-phosphate transferase [Chloroflexota bacterium]